MQSLFFAVVVASAFCSPAREDVPIDRIAKALRARGENLKSCRMSMKIHVTKRSELTGDLHDYATAYKISLDRILHRYRSRSYGSKLLPPASFTGNKEYLLDIEVFNVFDGEHTRNYVRIPGLDAAGKQTGRFIETCRVTKDSQPEWDVAAEDMVASSNGAELVDFIEDGTWSASRDGKMLLAESGTYKQGSDGYRGRVWLDPDRGMIPMRVQNSFLRAGDKDWVVNFESSVEETTEVKAGYWMPSKYQDAAYKCEPGKPSVLRVRNIAEITYSDIDVDFPADEFKLEFPPGLKVQDLERGTTYTSGEITDKTLEADARKSLELKTQYEQTRDSIQSERESQRRKRLLTTVVCGSAAVLALLLVAIALVRGRIKGGLPN